MKKAALLSLLLLCFYINAQSDLNIPKKFPTEVENSFTFSLGSKIVIELEEKENGTFDYRVLSVEKIERYYSFDEKKDVFNERPKDNTVEIFFTGAYYNQGKTDADWKTLLLLRNNLKTPIIYKADIKYYFSDSFKNTSIVGAFPNANTFEIWGHKIDFITLYDFELLKMDEKSP